jgi:hypothetical protein
MARLDWQVKIFIVNRRAILRILGLATAECRVGQIREPVASLEMSKIYSRSAMITHHMDDRKSFPFIDSHVAI